MRSRSKVLLAFGATCLSTAILASGALAHNKHREGGDLSSKGTKALKVEVRGAIKSINAATATTPLSITLTAAGTTSPAPVGFEWTCAIPTGADISLFTVGARVKAKCRSAEGTGLTLTKLRHKDKGDKVKVEARGTVSVLTATSITVQPGTGLPDVTCAIGPNTKVKGSPVVLGQAKIECKSKDGVLTAKKIAEKVVEVEAKGLLTIDTVAGRVTVGTVVCSIPAGTTVDPTLAGKFVEIKCLGTPPVLAKIELEDDN